MEILEYHGKNLYLHEVQDIDEVIVQCVEDALQFYAPNTVGPVLYLDEYTKYHYLLNGEATKSLKLFMALDPFPFMKVSF